MSNSSLESAISALSPTLWYKCTETSGTTLTNSGSATGCNLTLAGSYTLNDRALITGDLQKFLHLNSGTSTTGGRATSSGIGNFAAPITGDWTISFLIEFISAMNTNDFWMFSHGSTGETTATNYQFAIVFNYPSPIIYSFWEYGSGTNVTSTFANVLNGGLLGGYAVYSATSSNKFHITVVKNSADDTLKYYINGFFKESISYGSNEPAGGTSNSLRLGTATGSEAITNSTIGQLFYVSSVLSPSQILNLAYQAGFASSNTLETTPSISSEDITKYGSYSDIVSNLDDTKGSKRLSIEIDPSIDPTIINPDLVEGGFSV
jgi:hypothetical protein